MHIEPAMRMRDLRRAATHTARPAIKWRRSCASRWRAEHCAAITREALQMVAGCHLQTSTDALREFRRHRNWIEALATLMMDERCELTVVLTEADVCFQLANEAEMLIQAVRV
jgi:hypothetical protein